jgi:hypothetical protein
MNKILTGKYLTRLLYHNLISASVPQPKSRVGTCVAVPEHTKNVIDSLTEQRRDRYGRMMTMMTFDTFGPLFQGLVC